MRTVVGRIEHQGVVGDAEVVELLEQLADVPVMQHHGVGIFVLTRDAAILVGDMGAEMHMRAVPPHEERLALALTSSR